MSAGFGHNKGKDGKYNTINVNLYKGRSTDSAKHSGSTIRHGLQSLGKVAATRRVPPPASLPSLKSENLGNDPNVNIVPKDGSGWASKSETPTQQQQVIQTQPASQQRPVSTTYSQPSSNLTVSQSTVNNQNQPSTQSNGSSAPPTWGPSRYSQAGNKTSGVTGGAQQVHGTTHFSEEFPTLGDDAKEQSAHGIKTKEQQYGPGPSLRPQNVASWRGGGGQNLAPKETYSSTDDSKNPTSEAQSHGGSTTGFDGSQIAENSHGRTMVQPNVAQSVPSQGYPGQFRPNMMHPPLSMPFMYNNRFPHGMPPPGPGMRYSNSMMPGMRYHPYPNDPRFRPMMNQPMSNQAQQEAGSIPSIISPSEFKDFDKLDKEEEGGWAGMHGEVDYSEKLVFSDDEDGSRQSSQNENSKFSANSAEDDKMERKHNKDSATGPQQQWQANMYEQHRMYMMYRGAGVRAPLPGQPVDFRSKNQMQQYDKRIPPQGQPYSGGMAPPMHSYGGPPQSIRGARYSGPMVDPNMERLSPRGDEEHWKKKEKEEAVERARKRREEEEKRMEKQRSSNADDSYYTQADQKHSIAYSQRYASPEEELHGGWPSDFPPGHEEGAMYGRRTESESSDDRKALRDRLPGDGYGGHRPQPRPSAGGSGGRNLPPRLAQRQKQDWQARAPSPGYQAADSQWMVPHQPHKHMAPPSIMKRERAESDGSEIQDGRSRKYSESSSHSLLTPGEAPSEEKRIHSGQEFFRKTDRKFDEQRGVENASPSTVSSDREPRLWDAGSSKRSSIKRQSSRESPVSIGSGVDVRLPSQKSLAGRGDNRGKIVTRCGSNQSNQSIEREEAKQPATVKPRRSFNDKVKLRDFRVEGGDEEETNFKSKKPTTALYKAGKNNKLSSGSEEPSTDIQSSWKNEHRVSKPIATVSPTATTTTTSAARDSQASFNITRITREVIEETEQTNDSQEEISTSSRRTFDYERGRPEHDQSTHIKSAWGDEGSQPQAAVSWDDEDATATDLPAPKESHSNKDYNRRNKGKPEGDRDQRNHYDNPPKRAAHRYSGKEYRNTDRPAREYRGDNQEARDANKGVRRYRSGDDRYRSSAQERGPRSGGDRYENRNRRETRELKSDSKANHNDNKGYSTQSSQHSQKSTVAKSQPAKMIAEKPLFSKPTAAAVPVTNVWEERKRQFVQQKEAEKNIYIPTEDDKKRTLKETAPISRTNDDGFKISKDDKDKPQSNMKKSRDDNYANKKQSTDARSRHGGYPDKRLYEAKPYRNNSARRGGPSARASSNRIERKSSRDFVGNENNERDQRTTTRGRGRSRGSARGRAPAPYERTSSRNQEVRGRGSSGYRSSQYFNHSSRTIVTRRRANPRKNDDDPRSNDEESYESDYEPVSIDRRRRVGERSDAEDEYSTEGTYSDTEPYVHKQPRHRELTVEHNSKSLKSNPYKTPRQPGRGRTSNGNNAGFAPRGEPSRRGRGRGASAGVPRGRGRGSTRGSAPAIPSRSYRGDDYNESKKSTKNLDRGAQEGADKRLSPDKRRKRKPDKPPRFARGSGRVQQSRDSKTIESDASAPGHRDAFSPIGDGGTVNSSDVGNDEWETASDNSTDTRKVTIIPPSEEYKKSEPKRSFTNQRPPSSGRGRGGTGAESRILQNKKAMDNQVYTIHTVNYSNPSAIEGAIRDATISEDARAKKQQEALKNKQELFQMYDLNDYAGVVNVDDIPETSDPKNVDSGLSLSEMLPTEFSVDSTGEANVGSVVQSGFTQVLSKKALKALRKKQEMTQKREKEEKTNEAMRRAKVEQQRQNRQKFFNKSSTTAIASGSSGSIKQSVSIAPTDSNLWTNLDAWASTKTVSEPGELGKEVSISQHDSGVESSVPSSQRNSPGTEAKLSFSHFGVVVTSTSVTTSMSNDQISSSVVSHSSVVMSNLMSTQAMSADDFTIHEEGNLPPPSLVYDLDEVSSTSRSHSLLQQSDNFNLSTGANMKSAQNFDLMDEVSSTSRNLSLLQHSDFNLNTGANMKSGQNYDLIEPPTSGRSAANPIGPIGNERMKVTKSGESVENISCLFPKMDDKNSISFIADDAKTEVAHAPDDIRSSIYSSPFAERSNEVKDATSFGGNFSPDQTASDLALSSLSVPSFSMPLTTLASSATPHSMNPSSVPSSVHSSFMDRHTVDQSGFMHSSPASKQLQEDSTTDHSTPLSGDGGVKTDTDTPTDMTLSPQAPANDTVDHSGRSLEGSTVPGPIPLPPKHTVGSAQRPDGDSQSESRPLHEVNANANGAGDMGLMPPASPSVDFNMKMESARKAWELSETPLPSSQQPHSEPSESFPYHQSATSATEHLQVEQSTLPSSSLSVSKSSEWQSRPVETSSAVSEPDDSWRANIAQQSQVSNTITSVNQAQSFTQNNSATSSVDPQPSIANTGYVAGTSGSTSTTQSQQLKQISSQSYSSSGGLLYINPSLFTQTHGLPAPQASQSTMYQAISSSSLANNLHSMQQAYANVPPDYSTTLYSPATPSGYNSLTQNPSYGATPRDYNQQVMFATTTVATSSVKPPSHTTVALKPVQPHTQVGLRDAGLHTAYVGASAIQDQQGNIGSSQLGIPRPHSGTSPAQPPIAYILDQNRMVASQASAVVNTIAPPQRPQSTSFYSQLNQNSSYYPQQQASHLRQQPAYQQAIVAPQHSQGLGLDSPSIWTLGGMQQNPGFAPIAPPAQQRIRSDDYQGYSYYQQKNVFAPTVNKFVPSSSQTHAGYATIKPNLPSSSYDVAKANQLYTAPKVSTPGSHDHQLSKFPMSTATTPPNKSFNNQSIGGGDWNKSAVMSSHQQYKTNSVQGLLSRPYSSSVDVSFHQSPPSISNQSYFQKPDMNMAARMTFPHQPNLPRPFNPQQSGWGQQKPQSGQGLMGAQPPPTMMPKVPHHTIAPAPIMGQRFGVPQNYQQQALPMSQVSVASRSMPFSMKQRPTGAMRMPTPTSQQYSSPENPVPSSKGNKPSHSQPNKAPPLPTLVRGAGSNLAGKKPTFMPEEVVKSNQASERASLLQSLSDFFPDKASADQGEEKNQDWSSQVANSSPLPKRKPGMRHPGIERRRPGKDSKGSNESKNSKRQQSKYKKDDNPPQDAAEAVVRPVKKMTLADTKPKKGEVAKIQIPK